MADHASMVDNILYKNVIGVALTDKTSEDIIALAIEDVRTNSGADTSAPILIGQAIPKDGRPLRQRLAEIGVDARAGDILVRFVDDSDLDHSPKVLFHIKSK